MFEIEDMSAGFHDVFLNKYADSSGPILDFFISDSMQDMLDIDIRTEVATVVGGVNEFTSLVNDIPSLDIHAHSNSNDGDIWFGGPKWSATNDIYADVGACVNPNSVMPLIASSLLNSPKSQLNLNTNNFQPSNSPLPSPKENKSHLTFSPNQIKVRPIEDMKRQITNNNMITLSQQNTASNTTTTVETIKKDLSSELKEEKLPKIIPATPIPGTIMASGNTIKLAPGIGGLTFANSMAYSKLKQNTTPSTVRAAARSNTAGIVTHIKRERDSSPLQHINNSSTINGNIYSSNGGLSSPKILSRNILISANKTNLVSSNSMNTIVTQQINNMSNSSIIKAKIKPTGQEYPKPAYSYSCLIAMALKNSRSGSLPVSEIYSFMCEHFPYFKTAPNGWKNSVRHNLSLNKCFEKIEKPATNGGQRKGCLWAMNPEKITKMDEEVQKWSRKDPMAIRKAMVFPEHLEALERGEMKHGSTGDSDGENDMQSDVEESSDIEPDNELDDQLIETPESMDDDDEEKFDIEVANIYDTIDICDNKESLRMTIRQNELYDMSECETPTRKKSRLDINYSIAPAVFDYHIQPQPSSQQHHNRRKMQLVNRIV